MSEADNLAEALEDLLDRERSLLLTGSLDGLGRIAAEKESLLSRLGSDLPSEVLPRIREKAQRNARLLEAAGAGVRSVTRRIADLRAGPKPLSTYSPDGRKEDLGAARSKVERRA